MGVGGSGGGKGGGAKGGGADGGGGGATGGDGEAGGHAGATVAPATHDELIPSYHAHALCDDGQVLVVGTRVMSEPNNAVCDGPTIQWETA